MKIFNVGKSNDFLEAKSLYVSVEDKELLTDINLKINQGETHVLMGPNGAGKSTLGYTLMGNPKYKISSGNIYLCNEDITKISTDKRARKGLFLSFQTPLDIPGISVEKFIKSSLYYKTGKNVKYIAYKKRLNEVMELLDMDESYAERDLNVDFSGGERKKTEILQLIMLEPKFAILDETDSGLDIDAVKAVSKGIREYQKKDNGGLLIITHSTRILENLNIDYVHVLVKGRLVATGGKEIIDEINKNGFEKYERN